MRTVFALVLADVLDLEWPESFAKLVDPTKEDQGTLTLGKRMERIQHAIKVHSGAPNRVLPDLSAWWRDVNQSAWALVAERNSSAHGHSLADEAPDAARDRLAAFLCSATWLQEVQLVYLPSKQTRERGRNIGRLVRLRGASPFTAPMLDVATDIDLESEAVYLGRADGTLWTLNPFVAVEKQRVFVLNAMQPDGSVHLIDPENEDPALSTSMLSPST